MGGERWTGSVHFTQIDSDLHARETTVPTAKTAAPSHSPAPKFPVGLHCHPSPPAPSPAFCRLNKTKFLSFFLFLSYCFKFPNGRILFLKLRNCGEAHNIK